MNAPSIKDKKKIIFSNLVDVFFMIVIVLCFYLQIPINSSRIVYIPQGGTNEIITYLDKNNFDVNRFDGYMLHFFGYLQSGWLNIGQTRLTKGDFLYGLMNSKAALEDITLIPGETLYFFIDEVDKQLNLDSKKLELFYRP